MLTRRRVSPLFLVLLWITAVSAGAKEYSWAGCGTIALDLPKTWSIVGKESGETVYTFIATPRSGRRAEMILSLVQHSQRNGDLKADLASRLAQAMKPLLSYSEEKEVTVESFQMQQGLGLMGQLSGDALIGKLSIKLKHRVVRMVFGSLDEHCTLIAILTMDATSIKEADDMTAMVKSTVFKRSGPSAFLDVAVEDGNYVLTAPVSRLRMLFPRGELVESPKNAGGATNSPRYFYFVNAKQGFQVSGWFESDRGYKGIDKFWKSENKGDRLKVKNQSTEKQGQWDAIFYETFPPVLPSGYRQSHIRAEYARAGTWIDMHCSIISERSNVELREELISFLKSIKIEVK